MRTVSDHESRVTGHQSCRARGVTLIEMIVVITITGIIAAGVAMFIRRPVEGYVDAARRAELSDIADTALRRMTRDLRTALPNSVRLTTTGAGATTVFYLEYLQTSGGGRYRAELPAVPAGENILDFTVADSQFDVIGPMPTLAVGDSIVIYNLNSSGAAANAYSGANRAAYSSNTLTTITLTAATLFPFTSPGKRFQVVQYPVTYECNPVAQVLRRYWNYTIAAAQPTPTTGSPPAGAGTAQALLATNVTGCTFTYTEVTQRSGLLALILQVSRDGETVRLFQEAHVNNVP